MVAKWCDLSGRTKQLLLSGDDLSQKFSTSSVLTKVKAQVRTHKHCHAAFFYFSIQTSWSSPTVSQRTSLLAGQYTHTHAGQRILISSVAVLWCQKRRLRLSHGNKTDKSGNAKKCPSSWKKMKKKSNLQRMGFILFSHVTKGYILVSSQIYLCRLIWLNFFIIWDQLINWQSQGKLHEKAGQWSQCRCSNGKKYTTKVCYRV